MKVRREVVDDVLAHARAGYPYEVCGVLLRPARATPAPTDGALRIVASERMQNHESEQPRVRYQIDPLEQLRVDQDARARGLEIAGYYHSHPDHPARPSETDRRIAAEGLSDGVLHVVVGVQNGAEATPTAWVFHDAQQAFAPEPFEIE